MRGRYRQNTGEYDGFPHQKDEETTSIRQSLIINSSAINLTKNSQFYVRQADVERLIAQGFLQRLS